MKIALIECPDHPLEIDWEDVYFPETPFPISDFLHDEPNEVQCWDFREHQSLSISELVQALQNFAPVILGINDNHSTNGLVLERLIKQMFPRAMVFFCPGHMELETLLNSANESAYRLRQRTRPVSGKLRFRADWQEQELFADLPAKQQKEALHICQRLCEQYQLDKWRQYLPLPAYRQVLHTLEILEDCFPATSPIWKHHHLRLLDVGSARWAYAPALFQFFMLAQTDEPRQVFLTGIELDPYRLDYNGYSCVDHALSYIDPIATYSRYLNQNVLSHTPQQPYDVITCFNLAATCRQHLMSGLPLEYFQPAELFRHLKQILSPEHGRMLIYQESQEHHRAQGESLTEAELSCTISGAFQSPITGCFHGFVTVIE